MSEEVLIQPLIGNLRESMINVTNNARLIMVSIVGEVIAAI